MQNFKPVNSGFKKHHSIVKRMDFVADKSFFGIQRIGFVMETIGLVRSAIISAPVSIDFDLKKHFSVAEAITFVTLRNVSVRPTAGRSAASRASELLQTWIDPARGLGGCNVVQHPQDRPTQYVGLRFRFIIASIRSSSGFTE